MKASELIEELQKLVEKHGDISVSFQTGSYQLYAVTQVKAQSWGVTKYIELTEGRGD